MIIGVSVNIGIFVLEIKSSERYSCACSISAMSDCQLCSVHADEKFTSNVSAHRVSETCELVTNVITSIVSVNTYQFLDAMTIAMGITAWMQTIVFQSFKLDLSCLASLGLITCERKYEQVVASSDNVTAQR